MYDNTVTRLQYGLTNARETELFSDLPVQDYTKLHDYLDDFDYYTGPVAAGTTNGFTLTGTGATAAMVAGDGGVVNIIGATTAFIAAWQRATANFKTELGKRTWFEALALLSTLANSTQLLIGLTNITTTPFTAGQLTDGIWLSSDTGGTGILSVNVAVGSVVTTVVTGVTLVANTQFAFRFYWDAGVYAAAPNGRIVWELTGAGVSAPVRGSIAAPANFPGATLMSPLIAVKGTAGTPTIGLDLLTCVKDRANINATPTF